ncbi:hypothetical protein TrLO_g3337 [Triparma laevis f. longispina]|uniref:Thioredoxin domain-containing protein n=1 Tax=Triparma laevis f. longispina TaxID=1714387 RepID=A0A9W7FPY3_9STRA|nr:hypothetical protein TrLO_g3337 [Triparma laevis f. longispina]
MKSSIVFVLGALFAPTAFAESPFLGKVNVLTVANFDAVLQQSEDTVPMWLLDFYAPWCGHCKRLAPVLDELVLETDKMAVGTIDATSNRKLADKFSVKGFPTLFFHRNGVTTPYKGSRSKGALKDFAERMAGPPVSEVKSMDTFVSGRGVAFVLKGEENDDLEKEFFKVASDMQATEQFGRFKSKGAAQVCLVEKSEEPYCVDASSKKEFEEFVKQNNYNVVTELSAETFQKMVNIPDMKLAVGVVKPASDNDGTTKVVEEMRGLGRALRQDEELKGKFAFVYIDGERYADWVKGFSEVDIEELPTVFVFDNKGGSYFLNTENWPLKQFLKSVDTGAAEKIKYDKAGNKSGGLTALYDLFMENLPWSFLVLLPFAALIGLLIAVIFEDTGESAPPSVDTPTDPATKSDKTEPADESKKDK